MKFVLAMSANECLLRHQVCARQNYKERVKINQTQVLRETDRVAVMYALFLYESAGGLVLTQKQRPEPSIWPSDPDPNENQPSCWQHPTSFTFKTSPAAVETNVRWRSEPFHWYAGLIGWLHWDADNWGRAASPLKE